MGVGLNLSGLGGISQGLQGGADLRQKQQAIAANKQKLALATQAQHAAAADLQALLGPSGSTPGGAPPAAGGQPTPLGQPSPALAGPAPGGPPPQAGPAPGGAPPQAGPAPAAAPGGGMPAPVSMPGATPMPQQGGPSPAPAPPAGGPAPSPQGGQPSPPAGGDQMSGVASPTGSYADNMNKTLKSIAADIQRSNPGIDPATAMAAVEHRLTMMKGIEPEDRAVLQYQASMAKLQMQHQEDREKIQSASDLLDRKEKELDARAAALDKLKADIAAGNNAAKRDVAATSANARTTAAGIGANARVTSAGIGAGSREKVAGMNDASRERVAGGNNAARRDVAGTAANARRDSSAMANPAGAKAMGYKPGGAAPASGGDSLPTPPKGKYKSPQDVQAAVHGGKLSAAQGAGVLKRDFGFTD